jgi:hypothetical protein
VGFTLAAQCYEGGSLLFRAGQDSVTTMERFLVLSEIDVRSITYYDESPPVSCSVDSGSQTVLLWHARRGEGEGGVDRVFFLSLKLDSTGRYQAYVSVSHSKF